MEKMRELTKSLVDDDGNVTAIDVTVGSRPLNCDNSYFGSYSHYGIHHEMLNVSPKILNWGLEIEIILRRGSNTDKFMF